MQLQSTDNKCLCIPGPAEYRDFREPKYNRKMQRENTHHSHCDCRSQTAQRIQLERSKTIECDQTADIPYTHKIKTMASTKWCCVPFLFTAELMPCKTNTKYI